MPQPDTSRRLQAKTLSQDVDSLHGLAAVPHFVTNRADASPEALRLSYELMVNKQQAETKMLALQKNASDEARQAEWEFHNAILSMKESVRGQFGSDSNEVQAIGYKKKSDRKRPRRLVKA